MNRYIKLLLSATALLSTLPATGGAPQLVFVDDSDQTRIFGITDVSRVTFGEDGLTVTTTDDSEIPYASFTKMIFDHEGVYNQSSAGEITADLTGRLKETMLLVDNGGQSLALRGLDGGKTDVKVFSTTGRLLLLVKDYAGGDIDISSLSPGVYIVGTNSSSTKFIKQ